MSESSRVADAGGQLDRGVDELVVELGQAGGTADAVDHPLQHAGEDAAHDLGHPPLSGHAGVGAPGLVDLLDQLVGDPGPGAAHSPSCFIQSAIQLSMVWT
ncbi:MAG: hypothetical protein HS111_29275 [Kofleriaceae bacterium]|nr:hypothetical protein [Kofleriaceae bacterium]